MTPIFFKVALAFECWGFTSYNHSYISEVKDTQSAIILSGQTKELANHSKKESQ